MSTIEGSLRIITNPAVLKFIMKGVAFTLIISVVAVLMGIFVGSILALVCNYCNRGVARILKWMAIVYIPKYAFAFVDFCLPDFLSLSVLSSEENVWTDLCRDKASV